MSNFLSQVTHTTSMQTGIRIVIAGVEKAGKTTMACGSPRPLLIPLEQGFAGMSCQRTPLIKTYDELTGLLAEITQSAQKNKFQFKTLVFDSATSLERIMHDKTLQSDSGWKAGNPKGLTMASALGGYGKAYQYADELCAKFLSSCDDLATYAGINIVLTCHVFASKVLDPTSGEFNQWDLLLHSPKDNRSSGKREMITQWADVVGFLYEPIFVSKNSETFSQGISANKGRVLGLERTPGYVAGNRFNMCGEIAIPREQSWNYLADAIYKSSGRDIYNRD